MRRASIVTFVGLALLGALGMARPAIPKTEVALKAEDDFQLTKVADGVFAAIAKPQGLASGNAVVPSPHPRSRTLSPFVIPSP